MAASDPFGVAEAVASRDWQKVALAVNAEARDILRESPYLGETRSTAFTASTVRRDQHRALYLIIAARHDALWELDDGDKIKDAAHQGVTLALNGARVTP